MKAEKEIVISGISGRFPKCHNVEEFKEALLRGDDLMTSNDKRFPAGLKGLPKRQGKVPDIDKFDASFFGLHSKQAHFTDPRQRILLETAYEAIIDAGFNPQELRGSKTGVFIGLSLFTNFTESTAEDTSGYSILGGSHTSAANRISYCFNFNGPSYALDTGCSSSLYAFTQAVDLLKKGEIEYAIVGGTHLGLHPEESLQYHNLKMLSPDGKCKVFSKERNGFARSEAVCCYFLQKRARSKRIYAVVLGAKTNTNGYVKEGYTVPSAEMQLKLMQELYKEANVNIEDVTYVEMHGTGSRVGDIVECQSIVDMFCKDRKKPLLVGSVKSNMGHGETVSGLAAITKVVLAMETGILPANLHTHPIDESLPGIGDKKLQVVTSNTTWKPSIVGINSFGFGGANAHIILKPVKERKMKPVNNRKNRLVHVSGRTEDAVNYLIDQIEKNQNDEEFLSLLDEIHKSNIEGHYFRGYTVLGVNPTKGVTTYKSGNRPIWFIFSGMGSHWPGMGKDLMNIEIFRNTFNRCAAAVKPYGIDLLDVVMSPSAAALVDLGNCFTAIIAIMISLVDFLASLGIKPDFFAGHSLGEVGCAYANGDLTPEQAVLLAYAKNYAVKMQKLPPGQMAVVGLSANEIKKRLPSDIFIACLNGRNNVTISGPEQSVKDFVETLTKQGIFARYVYTGGVAFHSKYLMDSGKHLLDFVDKVIHNPQPRSGKWISSSLSPENTNEDWSKYNCAEYHTNNYMRTVLFDKIYEQIQSNAIVIEIAPHGIMQSIMKKELGPDNTLISLQDKNVKDQEQCLLSGIGRIFNAGVQPNLRALYTETTFPVNPGTRMLSPLVKWDHSTSWFVPYWKNKDSFGQTVSVNLSDEKYSYLKGHNIDGKIVMPAAGYLEMVWKVKAEMSVKDFTKSSIVFENVVFKSSVTLPENENVKFLISIMKESGYFEILRDDSLIVTGKVRIITDPNKKFIIKNIDDSVESKIVLKREDFYKEAHLRRYLYWNMFQGIVECDVDGLKGKLGWSDNYVTFLDSMLQMSILKETSRHFLLPCSIRKVVVDPISHIQDCANEHIEVRRDPYCNITKTKGIEISGLKFTKIPLIPKLQQDLLLESFEFVHFDSPENDKYDFTTSLIISVQIIIQNTPGLIKKLAIGEVQESDEIKVDSSRLKQIVSKQVMTEVEYMVVKMNTLNEINQKFEVIVIDEDSLAKLDIKILPNILRDNGFIIYVGNTNENFNENYDTIFRSPKISLLRLKNNFPRIYDTINIRTSDFKWLEKLKKCSQSTEKRTLFLFSQNDDSTGIIGLQKCLMTEGMQVDFKAVCIDSQEADIFSVDDDFYREQLSKGLTLNVLRDNWGTYVHLPLEELKPKHSGNAAVSMKTLQWIEKPVLSQNHSHSEIVEVHYSALNSKACQIFDDELDCGVEYSGITKTNRKIMGLVDKGSLALEITNNPDFTWDVPIFWSLEQATTVPLAYSLCYYGLIIKRKIERNTSILIHDATTDIGIAVISTALTLNLQIFATVESLEKLTFLQKLFPQLDFNNIGVINNFSFEALIKRKTKGKGVDTIVYNLREEYFESSLNCLSIGGFILEIYKINSESTTFIDSCNLSKNFSFYTITLNDMFEEATDIKNQIRNLVKKGIESGNVKPIPTTIFEATNINLAFNLLSSNNNSGKILIKLKDESQNPSSKLLVRPQLYFDPDKTYIIIGGLGGFGLELTSWLIEKGAKKIVLNGRRDISNGYQLFCIKKWSQIKEVVIKINLSDTTTLNGAEDLVKFAEDFGPIGGIFNAAIVLKDANIINQTESNFAEVFKPKIISGQNMDIVTRKHCSVLDHFVVFSSVWAGRGHIGQTNYGMANSALEKLCEKRRKDNLPGIAVQWGPVGEVGYLALTRLEQKEIFNMAPQRISSCLESLERFIIQEITVGSSIVLTQKLEVVKSSRLKTSAETVADILGIEHFDSINQRATLSQLGLDSLMLAEVKHTLYRHFDLDIGPEAIRDLTFEFLVNFQTDNSKLKSKIIENFPPPLLSATPLIKLSERGSKDNCNIVFMIHPIEGYLHYLRPLANNLSITVYGVQCTKESNHGTIQETAKYFLKLIKTVQETGPYYLCGYSYGATLAFEIGLQLEVDGEKVQIVAIDGAPDYARDVFEDGNVMNQKIIRLFPALFKQVDLDKVKPLINKYKKPEDSIYPIFELISQETGLKLEDIRNAGEQYFSRCNASFHYHPSRKFTGKLKLIRRLHNPQAKSDDYGLQKIPRKRRPNREMVRNIIDNLLLHGSIKSKVKKTKQKVDEELQITVLASFRAFPNASLWDAKICNQPVEVTKLNGDHITILFGENLDKLSKIINNWINSHKKNKTGHT